MGARRAGLRPWHFFFLFFFLSPFSPLLSLRAGSRPDSSNRRSVALVVLPFFFFLFPFFLGDLLILHDRRPGRGEEACRDEKAWLESEMSPFFSFPFSPPLFLPFGGHASGSRSLSEDHQRRLGLTNMQDLFSFFSPFPPSGAEPDRFLTR